MPDDEVNNAQPTDETAGADDAAEAQVNDDGTAAVKAATAQPRFQELYAPLPVGFVNVEWNDVEAIKAGTTSLTCAVMLEPIQGEAGVRIPDEDYLRKVRDWCDDKGLLLILDEIQTGVARTGTLFAYEQFGVEPDIMTLAKGLGSGVPIGALLATEKASAFQPGDHGGTFGGNPLACAAGYAVMTYVIRHGLASSVKQVGEHFMQQLDGIMADFDVAVEARGRGLLIALDFKEDIADELTLRCLNGGLLVNRVRPNTLRFMPPLIVSNEEIDEAMQILRTVLSSL